MDALPKQLQMSRNRININKTDRKFIEIFQLLFLILEQMAEKQEERFINSCIFRLNIKNYDRKFLLLTPKFKLAIITSRKSKVDLFFNSRFVSMFTI